ncbi:fasciclin-2-like isoform X3 [Gigantopelta aegis]|uniref:fasciclin-2-like isoform X3 n=1 Tax=Gigantopelta aegis TaxID=1735272 RepID=UPI001B88A570|nr:fasciclin-2-like isoform X3 [Gigantopelta aegis]
MRILLIMDLPLRALLLYVAIIVAVSYAQELVLEPEGPSFKNKVGATFSVECRAEGIAAEEDPNVRWFNKEDNHITNTQGRLRIMKIGATVSLFFAPLQDGDEGEYTCKATISGKEVVKNIDVSLYRGISINSPTNQRPNIYTNALIECNATADPQPTIMWLFGNYTEVPLGGRFVPVNTGLKGLRIKNITAGDNGKYICLVRVKSMGQTEEHKITVKVRIPPSMVKGPTISDAIAGQRFQMTCEATGDPKPKFHFFKDHVKLRDGPQYKIDDTNGVLTIEELKDSHEGLYVCMAYNKGGNASADINVDVIVPPTIEEVKNVSKPAGEAAAMICISRGDPVPAMSWKIYGTNVPLAGGEGSSFTIETSEVPEGRITKKTYSLKFASLAPEDTNNYTCTAMNTGGSQQRTGSLIVEFKPHFTNTPYSETFGWANHVTEIKCVADGAPEPTISWSHNGQVLDSKFVNDTYSQSIERGVRQLRSTLTVKITLGNRDFIFGVYICKATNIHGTTPYEIALSEAGEPGAPFVSTMKTTPTTIQLMISPPANDGGQDILDYKIVYNLEGKEEVVQAPVSNDPSEPRTKFTLSNLKANSDYRITVSSRNAVGYGAETVLSETTPNVRIPGKPVITSSHYGDKPTSYTATWEEPLTGGSPLTHYDISYSKVEVKGEAPNWMVDRILNGPIRKKIPQGEITNYRLDRLEPETFYKVDIIAVNSIGESPVGSKIFKTSKGLNEATTTTTTTTTTSTAATASSRVKPTEPTRVLVSLKVNEAQAGLATGAIVGILIAILIILFVVIDVSLYFTKQCGVLWFLQHKMGAGAGESSGAAGAMEEGDSERKEPLLAKDEVKVESEEAPEEQVKVEDETMEEKEPEDKEEKPSDTLIEESATEPDAEKAQEEAKEVSPKTSPVSETPEVKGEDTEPKA